jgi:hypothetical protein
MTGTAAPVNGVFWRSYKTKLAYLPSSESGMRAGMTYLLMFFSCQPRESCPGPDIVSCLVHSEERTAGVRRPVRVGDEMLGLLSAGRGSVRDERCLRFRLIDNEIDWNKH